MKNMDDPIAIATDQNGVPLNNSAEVPQVRVPDLERIRNARRGRMLQLKEWQQYDRKMMRESEKLQKKGLAQSTERNYFAPGRTVKFPQSLIFLEAAARGDLDEVRKLLSNGVCPDVANEDGLTALHQCCIDNVPEMCRLLLRFGANPNARDTEKWTPLHAAATCEHTELCGILIAHGADLLAMNADGNMPYECCQPGPTLSLIETEMDKRGITQEELDDLHRLPECQMLADMETLYKAGKDFNGIDSQGASLLHIAAACGYEEVTIFLLKHGAKIDLLDRDGWQAIHIAACWGHLEVIERLVNFGADIMAKTTSGESVFDICEDDEMQARLTEIKEEMERKQFQAQSPQNRSGKQRELVRRRSSNNPRTASIRRSSMREKKMMSWKEAKQEAEMRGVTTANLGNADEWPNGQDATKLNSTAPTKTGTYPPSPALPKIRSPPRINSPGSSDSAYSPPMASPDQSGLSSILGSSPSPDYNNSPRPDRIHPLPPLSTYGNMRQPNGVTSPPNLRPTTNRQADKNKFEDSEPFSNNSGPLGSEQALRYSEFFAQRQGDSIEVEEEEVPYPEDEKSVRTIFSDEDTSTYTPPIIIYDDEDSTANTLVPEGENNGANAIPPDSGLGTSPSSNQRSNETIPIRIVTEAGANRSVLSWSTSPRLESPPSSNEHRLPMNVTPPDKPAYIIDVQRSPSTRQGTEQPPPVFKRAFERSPNSQGSPGSIRRTYLIEQENDNLNDFRPRIVSEDYAPSPKTTLPEHYTDSPLVPPRTIRITSVDRDGISSTPKNSPQYSRGRETTLSEAHSSEDRQTVDDSLQVSLRRSESRRRSSRRTKGKMMDTGTSASPAQMRPVLDPSANAQGTPRLRRSQSLRPQARIKYNPFRRSRSFDELDSDRPLRDTGATTFQLNRRPNGRLQPTNPARPADVQEERTAGIPSDTSLMRRSQRQRQSSRSQNPRPLQPAGTGSPPSNLSPMFGYNAYSSQPIRRTQGSSSTLGNTYPVRNRHRSETSMQSGVSQMSSLPQDTEETQRTKEYHARHEHRRRGTSTKRGTRERSNKCCCS